MLTFEMSKRYKGTGISNGLDRGMLVYQNGDLLLDEGMGMGSLALQSGGMNYFASIKQITNSSDSGRVEVTLSVDRMLQRTIYGIPSKPLTRFIEKVCTNMYKEREQGQGIWFVIGGWINFVLQIKVDFVPVPSKGIFQLSNEILKNEVRIELSGNLEEAADKIFVMNELSGRLFDHGMINDKITPPPLGWQKTAKGSRLYSAERGLTFTADEIGKPDNLSTQLYWGREADKDHCWAGFIYELQTKSKSFQKFQYSILFQERG